MAKSLAGQASCDCFGVVSVDPRLVALFDIVALVGLYLIGPTPAPNEGIRKVALLSAVWMVIALPLVVGEYFRRDIPHPLPIEASRPRLSEWIGSDLPILGQLDRLGSLGSGAWIVVLYQPDLWSM